MSTKPNRPKIEDLPRLEIVPVQRPENELAEYDIEHTIPPNLVESVWVWRPQAPKGVN